MTRKVAGIGSIPADGGASQHPSGKHSKWPIPPDMLPPVLARNTILVDEPDRIYAVSRFERQWGFRSLLQRYTRQLIDGCSEPLCSTPTCFTFRQRATQRPLRKLTTLSARTIASYLATRDDPEEALCPHKPRDTALLRNAGSHLPSSRRASGCPDHPGRSCGPDDVVPAQDSRVDATEEPRRMRASTIAPELAQGRAETPQAVARDETGETARPSSAYSHGASGVPTLRLAPVKKDPKSFAQNLFDTVPLSSMFSVPRRASTKCEREGRNPLGTLPDTKPPSGRNGTARSETEPRERSQSGMATAPGTSRRQEAPKNIDRGSVEEQSQRRRAQRIAFRKECPECLLPTPTAPKRTSPKDTQALKPSSQVPTSQQASFKDGQTETQPAFRSLQVPAADVDMEARHGRKLAAQRTQPTESTVTPASPPTTPVAERKAGAGAPSGPERGKQVQNHTSTRTCSKAYVGSDGDRPRSRPTASSLSHLSLETVHALSQLIISVDNVSQDHRRLCRYFDRDVNLRLPQQRARTYSLGQAAHSYVDQSIYYSFSDPEAILASFKADRGGKSERARDVLSQTLPRPHDLDNAFRLLLRDKLTLVSDSLWEGIESLFVPPSELFHPKSPRRKPQLGTSAVGSRPSGTAPAHTSGRPRRYLEDSEAAHIIALSLHALVAAVPRSAAFVGFALAQMRASGCVGPDMNDSMSDDDTNELFGEMMRCVEVFENEQCLRLAGRLIRALATRIHFNEILTTTKGAEPGIIDTLCAYLAEGRPPDALVRKWVLGGGRGKNLGGTGRGLEDLPWAMPAVLVEWIRTVIMKSWDGKGEVGRFGVVGSALTILQHLHDKRAPLGLKAEVFHIPYLSDRLDPLEAPVEWQSATPTSKNVHLLSYPFIFPPATLFAYFRSLNFSCMSRAFETSVTHLRLLLTLSILDPAGDAAHKLIYRLKTAVSTFLVLEVRRNHILVDAFDQLWRRERRELLRPLKVRMGINEGEEGLDQGGVQQEFFRIAVSLALDPDYGLFTTDTETGMSWFQPASLEPLYKFELLGLLVSLAIYNGATLPVNFPGALYRKLLGLPVNKLEHIEDGWRSLAKGFADLLDWNESDVQDVFMRTYEFSFEAWGRRFDVDMQRNGRDDPWSIGVVNTVPGHRTPAQAPGAVLTSPNPNDNTRAGTQADRAEPANVGAAKQEPAMVTSANRVRYVEDYVFWLADKSIRPQYEAFAKGFFTCLNKKALSMFTPEALRTVIEGTTDIDIQALEEAVRYGDGYSSGHPTIGHFWDVVHGFSAQQRKQLLEFVTASERVPVSGLEGLQFTVMRNGPDTERLPTSHTCFGRLLLPEYSSVERLREKLTTAVENCRGFGSA